MFAILTDHHNLTRAFARLSMLEAIRVKRNVDQVFTDLNMPSAALIEKMREEGLLGSLSTSMSKPDHLTSQSVLQNHLSQLFLDYSKLKQTLEQLSLAEKICCKETVDIAMLALNLPSDSLADMMAQEGVSVDHIAPQDPHQQQLDSVRARLNQAAQKTASQDAQSVRERLNALAQGDNPKPSTAEEDNSVVPLRRHQA
ncbi:MULTISPECIES: hypothetical protein [unclassified Pseudoalteromonas]|uniref:hypothetical protein n=1 Tax=unclassified Pseudoalteromonas TaxID=194690 RepID=UPI000CF6D63B|nr:MULTISPECIES: hypothetical protein [unclassified Pseudoalteromonas]